jgi:hypothetical protein
VRRRADGARRVPRQQAHDEDSVGGHRHSALTKHKVQLVARNFVQQEGIDYNDTFAPVACMESVRVFLTLVAQEGWRVHHMDVKSTFLNGDLKEEVYVRQPPGFAVAGEEDKVYHLH